MSQGQESGGRWAELIHRLARGPRGRSRGPRVLIVTDTAAGLPEQVIQEHATQLRVLPMPVTVDQQVYIEGVDDVHTELALGLAQGKRVTTSRPAPGQFLRVLDNAAQEGFDHVIIVTISSALSGTADAARWAAERSAVPTTVVDSLSVGLGEGFAVLSALERAAARAPLAEVLSAARSGQASMVWFSVPSLEQLRRGGRIGAAASVVGTLLSVKPLLSVNEAGAIVAAERTRSMAKAVARMIELGAAQAGEDPSVVTVGVHHFGTGDLAQTVVDAMAPLTVRPVLVTPVPAVLAAHTGAGAIALIVRRDPDVVPMRAGDSA